MLDLRWLIVLLGLMLDGGIARAEGIGWQEAVARLAHERTRAETCARLLVRYGDAAEVAKGEVTYGEGKAEIDAVIAGLVVALAQDLEPPALPDLEGRLQRGIKGREALCAQAEPLVPDTSGEKNLITDLAAGALGPLIEAVKEIYLDYAQAERAQDDLLRATIRTQLEATRWPSFDSRDS